MINTIKEVLRFDKEFKCIENLYRFARSNFPSPQSESLNTPLVSTLIMACCILDIICCVKCSLFSVSGSIFFGIILLFGIFSDKFLCEINIGYVKCSLISLSGPKCVLIISLFETFSDRLLCKINIYCVKCTSFSISEPKCVVIISLFGTFSDRLICKINICCCKIFTVESDSQNIVYSVKLFSLLSYLVN